MKVIHFITSIDKSSGGTTAYLQLLSDKLKNLVDLIIITRHTKNPIELRNINTKFLDIKIYRWFSLKREIYQLLVDEKPDIVHINGIWQPQTWLFQKIAQQLGIVVVLSPHGMLDPYILQRNTFKKKIAFSLYQRKAVHRANYLHATSELELSNIQKLGFNQRSIVVPNSVDIAEVQKTLTTTNNNKIKRVLFLSRIHSQKGVELLIEAAKFVQHDNFEIIITGTVEDAYKAKLNQLISEYKLNKKVYLHNAVFGSEKWQLFQSADIFVLPSFSECFGIVVAEALASGIPVISTKGTPWHELETYNCGWWINLSVENLAKTITEALSMNSEVLKEMGSRGRKLVEEKYDAKSVALKMMNFYEDIVLNQKMNNKELWFQRNSNTNKGVSLKFRIKLQIWRAIDTIFFKTSPMFCSSWRIMLLKGFGAKIGKGCYIAPKATIMIPWNFEMGNFSSIDDYAFIKPRAKVIIGDYVSISNYVHIIPGGHHIRSRGFESDMSPIKIDSGAFIGADAYISKGVHIGQMAVIGAKSVVLKDIPENTIAVGFPCKVKSERIPEEEYKKFRYHYSK